MISVNPPKIRKINYNVAVWLYPGAMPDQIILQIGENLSELVTINTGSVTIILTLRFMRRVPLLACIT